MANNFNEFMDEFNVHTSASNFNPHKVDATKPVTTVLQKELDKKVNVADIYNSTTDDSTKDLTNLPWSASQGYSMNNTIDAYKAQDTSALEARIAKCYLNFH